MLTNDLNVPLLLSNSFSYAIFLIIFMIFQIGAKSGLDFLIFKIPNDSFIYLLFEMRLNKKCIFNNNIWADSDLLRPSFMLERKRFIIVDLSIKR